MRLPVALLLTAILAQDARATLYVVAQSGGDFTAIQPALDAAQPGDTVRVREQAAPLRGQHLLAQ